MKKIICISMAAIMTLLSTTAFAQETIKFKGKDLVVAGRSAGLIKSPDNNPSIFECHWEINTTNHTLTNTIVQTFGNTENNKDIEVNTVAIADINKDLVYDEPDENTSSFGVMVYLVNLYTIGNKNTIHRKACYRFSEHDTPEFSDEVWTTRIVFSQKEEAIAFLQQLKAAM